MLDEAKRPTLKEYPFKAILEDWRKMLWHPHPELAELLLRTTRGRSSGLASMKDVEVFLRLIHQETPRPICDNVLEVNVNQDGRYKDTKVHSVALEGEHIPLSSNDWDEMVVAVCTKIAQDNPSDFARVLTHITSRRDRQYFSRGSTSQQRTDEIGRTGIFVEKNLSANNAVDLCEKVAELFGYWPIEIKSYSE